jgi:hypothetical protein
MEMKDVYEQSIRKIFVPKRQREKIHNMKFKNLYSLLHVIQTCSGVHATSYPMGTGGSFPGSKAARP